MDEHKIHILTYVDYSKKYGLGYVINNKMYGVYFKFGDCCEKINNFGDLCKSYYSTTIPNTELSYCRYHYKKGLNKYKQTEKIKLQEIKMDLKKEKENKLIENNKLLEALNIERELKDCSFKP